MKIDTYQEVTDRIIAALEAGAKPWEARWTGNGAGSLQLPLRACGKHYRGINVLLLWSAMMEREFAGLHWFTFKQAQALGGAVRKGERGTRIVFFKSLDVSKENSAGVMEDRKIPMLRTYTVFNADQVDGLPADLAASPVIVPATAGPERDSEREAALRSSGAVIRETGTSAYYSPAADTVTMPDFERFHSAGGYLATLAHELCHWTGHKARLDRDQRGTFGSPDYAREELVAELGAAFVGARLGIVGEHIESHAAYMGSWIKALQNDKRAIFRAASAAQAAADMVLANAGEAASHAEPASIASEEAAPIEAAPIVARREQLALAF